MGRRRIAIEKPEKQKRVWLAFSEHPWSAETIKAIEGDLKLRDQRMQTFLPATWIAAQGYKHGLSATQANIEQVIEYQASFNPDALNGGAHMPPVGKENGQYFSATLARQTSHHSAHTRRGQSQQVATIMQKTGEMANGKQNPPVMIALLDGVGITHELNGYRNDAAGWIDKYGQERELEISALNAIEGVKRALEKNANEFIDRNQRTIMSRGAFIDTMRVTPNPRGWPKDISNMPLTSRDDLLRYGTDMIEVFPPGHSQRVEAGKNAPSRTPGQSTKTSSTPLHSISSKSRRVSRRRRPDHRPAHQRSHLVARIQTARQCANRIPPRQHRRRPCL